MPEQNEPQFSQHMSKAEEEIKLPTYIRRKQVREQLEKIGKLDTTLFSQGKFEKLVLRYKALREELAELNQMFELIDDNLKRAEKIMGTDFIGPDQIAQVLDLSPSSIEVPFIPFSGIELERAKELGHFLILRVDNFTIQDLHRGLIKKLQDENRLFDTGVDDPEWFEDEDFYTDEKPRSGWALVSKELIPDSTEKDYFQQIESIVFYLKNKVFADMILPVGISYWKVAIKEYLDAKDGIKSLMFSNKRKALEKLASLKINNLTRQNAAEAFYDLNIYFYFTNEMLLPQDNDGLYMPNSCVTSTNIGGNFITVEDFDVYGCSIGYIPFNRSNKNRGVIFSRRM